MATSISNTDPILVMVIEPLEKVNSRSPAKEMRTPAIFFVCSLVLKNRIPISITKSGVRELRIPSMALATFSMAIANKKAGKRFPNNPERMIRGSLDLGT